MFTSVDRIPSMRQMVTDFAGRYESDELAVTYLIRADDEGFQIVLADRPYRHLNDRSLTLIGIDQLAEGPIPDLVYEFVRDREAKVVALRVMIPDDPHVITFEKVGK